MLEANACITQPFFPLLFSSVKDICSPPSCLSQPPVFALQFSVPFLPYCREVFVGFLALYFPCSKCDRQECHYTFRHFSCMHSMSESFRYATTLCSPLSFPLLDISSCRHVSHFCDHSHKFTLASLLPRLLSFHSSVLQHSSSTATLS